MSVVPLRPTGRRAPPSTFLTLEIARFVEREVERQKRVSECIEAIADLKRATSLLKRLQIAAIDREQEKRLDRLDILMQQVELLTLPSHTG